jgi:PAS domain S-box-containing protein
MYEEAPVEKILIVDDEPQVTKLLERRLTMEGYSCGTALSAEGALAMMKEEPFSAVLIDIRLPKMNGIELLEEVKNLDPDIAAVMVTAVMDRESAVEAMRLGADHYIVKPFDLEEVVTSVQKALEKRRLVLENKEYQRNLEKLVEERTKELERRSRELEAIFKETFDGLIVVDEDMRVMAFNPGAEVITGYSSEEVLGKRIYEVLGEEIYAKESPLRKAVLTGGRVLPTETTISGKLGVRDVLEGVTPLLDSEGGTLGYLMNFTDITKLKEVDRLKSNIVANVSHELRTPLASIKAYTELLLEELDEGDVDVRRRFLQVIDREADRLADLIGDLLDLSRLETGKFEMRKEPLHIGDIIKEVITLLELQAEEKRIQINVDAPPSISHITADKELMTILVKNLVSNAIKFSHDGGRIDIAVREGEGNIILSVADYGIGIPPEEIPHIFEKFYRVRSTTESGIEGTGLGLVLVKEAVEAHGGTIEVESELGAGSCFIVTLPTS